jgi:hypothetical protein
MVRGVPIAVTITDANVHYMHMAGATLDAVVVRRLCANCPQRGEAAEWSQVLIVRS